MTRSAPRRGLPASPLIDLAVTDPRGGGPFAAWCRAALESLEHGVALLDVSEHEPPRLLHSNPAFDRIAGLPPQRADAIPIYEIAESRFAAAIAGTCERCCAGEAATVDRYESREPERRIYEISGIPYRAGQERHRLVTVIARDITELEALRSTLHARDEAFHALIDNAPDLITRYDTSGRVLYANPTVERDGPVAAAEAVGRTSIELSPRSPGARRFHETVLQVALTGNPAELYVHIDAIEADTQVWHHVRFTAERDRQGRVASVLAIGRDVTEHRNLERALLDVANREQLRLGSELHDGLGQELTGLSLTAAALAEAIRHGRTPTAAALDSLADIAAGAIKTCREIALGLSPLATHDGDLVRALANLVDMQRRTYGVPVIFELTGAAPLRLAATQVDHLYRITQEALTNARKHANAGWILIGIDIQPDQVRLSVIDDGDGLPPATDRNHGLGLMTMRHRASIIGARFRIESCTDGGTRLVCECPQRV